MAAAGLPPGLSAAEVDRQHFVAQCFAQTANAALADWFSWTTASPVLGQLAVAMVRMHYWQQHLKAFWQASLYPDPATGCKYQHTTALWSLGRLLEYLGWYLQASLACVSLKVRLTIPPSAEQVTVTYTDCDTAMLSKLRGMTVFAF